MTPIILACIDASFAMERQALEKHLTPFVENRMLELKIIDASQIGASLSEFTKAENKNRIIGFHYGGISGENGLLASQEDGQATLDKLFTDFLGNHQESLQFVVLNSSFTEKLGSVLSGNHYIENVICTKDELSGEVANKFADTFYGCLSQYCTIYQCLSQSLAGGDGCYVPLLNYNQGKWDLSKAFPIKAFVINAPQDQNLVQEKLMTHLAVMKTQGLLKVESASDLQAGSRNKKALHEKIATADIVFFFLTPLFLSDPMCQQLMQAAQHRGKRGGGLCVVPLLISQVDIEGEVFSGLVALPRNGVFVNAWGGEGSAYYDISKEVRKLVLSLRKNKGYA